MSARTDSSKPSQPKLPRRRKIQHIIMMGDSLSDRGTMAQRKLLGAIPMDGLSGLKEHSPIGRFSNGFVWTDHIAAEIAEELTIRNLKNHGESAEDIADDIITHDKQAEKFENAFTLTDDEEILYCNSDFVRSYCEGGLSSADYSEEFSLNPQIESARLIVSNLAVKRKKLLEDDLARNETAQHKASGLIVEWSGANDLITVNEIITDDIIQKAVDARIENIRQLAAAGYQNFMLLDLADLSLTPRFQNDHTPEGEAKRKQLQDAVVTFNHRLFHGCIQLQAKMPQLQIHGIDVNSTFTDAFIHPERYHLNPNLLNTPYVDSADFKINQDMTSPARGYLFWDAVHPTSNVHAILAQKCYSEFTRNYEFVTPHEKLTQQFVNAYAEQFSKDKQGFFGFFKRSRFQNYKTATLEEIFNHALNEEGHRTFDVLVKLKWINSGGQLIDADPLLSSAFRHARNADVSKGEKFFSHQEVLRSRVERCVNINRSFI